MDRRIFFGATILVANLFFGCANSGGQGESNRLATDTNSLTSNNGATKTGAPAMNSALANASNTAIVQDVFWTKAAQGGMAEVETAKLALNKAQNAEVKKFAQQMITDHTKANDELKALASKKGRVLPTDLGPHQPTVSDLSKLNGAEFDKEYVDAMVEDHEEDVKLFEGQSKDNADADLQAFAAKTLPTLRSHLEMIKNIQTKMK